MIIAADIGNTNIKFGVFDGSADNMLYGFTVSASSVRSSDEYRLLINNFLNEKFTEVTFDGSVISSVVPALNAPVSEALTVICGRKPFFVGSGTKTGFPIKIDVVSEIGSDIVSNVARAHSLLSPPFAVVDMGTAITIAAVDRDGSLCGTVIAPGCGISLSALSHSAALLNDVEAFRPDSILGKNSQDSVAGGVYYGTVFTVDGFIRELREKLCREGEKLSLIATGGFSQVLSSCRNKFNVRPHLTLEGAVSLYYKNIRHN